MGSLALSLCHLAAGRVDARLLAEAGPGGGHRRRPAARAGARARDRPLRGAAVRCRPRSTWRGVHGSSQRERPRYAGSSQPLSPHRLLGLELRVLERRVLRGESPPAYGCSTTPSSSTRSR
jgi:hypothetical protein